MTMIPERFKDGVGKAQNHEVLYHLFAKIMIDAIQLILAEVLQQVASKFGLFGDGDGDDDGDGDGDGDGNGDGDDNGDGGDGNRTALEVSCPNGFSTTTRFHPDLVTADALIVFVTGRNKAGGMA